MEINWSKQQLELLLSLNFNFDVRGKLDDDQLMDIDEAVAKYFCMNCIENDEVVYPGIICEDIIHIIALLD